MEGFLDNLAQWVDKTAYNIWSILLFFLLAAGIWLTIRTRFVQFRHLGDAFKIMFAGLLRKGKRVKRRATSRPSRHSRRPWPQPSATETSRRRLRPDDRWPGAIFWLWFAGSRMAISIRKPFWSDVQREIPDGKIAAPHVLHQERLH